MTVQVAEDDPATIVGTTSMGMMSCERCLQGVECDFCRVAATREATLSRLTWQQTAPSFGHGQAAAAAAAAGIWHEAGGVQGSVPPEIEHEEDLLEAFGF